ncbi:MAG: type II toxin-antitoxin system VapC family toxin [Planctomycetes bacterium]|nr:type II toxin-antitoxin system VapC family toxin [Planctomycetota bacterium]
MKLLLDTHTVLWFYLADPQLSATASGTIMDPANEKWVSPASYWEIAIKISTGKYALAQPYEDFWRNAIDANGFQILPILPRHTALLTTMPYHHRDPFDRLIVAQAVAEGMSVVSADPIIDAYGVTRVW